MSLSFANDRPARYARSITRLSGRQALEPPRRSTSYGLVRRGIGGELAKGSRCRRPWGVCEAADRDTDDEDGCGCPGLHDGRPSPASQTERARALERRCGLRLFDALLIGLEHPLEPCARCRGVHQTCGKVAE